MDNIEDSYLYQSWLYAQYEPEDRLFVGRKPLREPKGWMLKRETREQLDQQEMENEKKNDDYLRKHEIDFK